METPSSRDAGTLTGTLLRGRVSEMASVDDLIASAVAGAGGTVIVEGAAGIGKTRVLAEGRARARAAGLLVADGSADELDQVTPWRALLRAFARKTSYRPPWSSCTWLGTGSGHRKHWIRSCARQWSGN
jgi:AAA ATPase domain